MPRALAKIAPLAFILMSANLGCLNWLVTGPPDTFEDMRRQVERFVFPSNAVLIGKHENGLRGRFAAAPPPYLRRNYSVPWLDGELCKSLTDIAPDVFDIETRPDSECEFEGWIPSGFRARLVNVWKYGLRIAAVSPEVVSAMKLEVDCELYKNRNATTAAPEWFRYHIGCWVEPNHALVTISLDGKLGW